MIFPLTLAKQVRQAEEHCQGLKQSVCLQLQRQHQQLAESARGPLMLPLSVAAGFACHRLLPLGRSLAGAGRLGLSLGKSAVLLQSLLAAFHDAEPHPQASDETGLH